MNFKTLREIWNYLLERKRTKSLRAAAADSVPVVTRAEASIHPLSEADPFLPEAEYACDEAPGSAEDACPRCADEESNGTAPESEGAADTNDADDAESKKAEPPEKAAPPPKDASVHAWAASNAMAAFLTVMPPTDGGQDITLEQLTEALESIHVSTNINHDLLQSIVDEKKYHKTLMAARGIPPVHGINGKIKDYYSREKELRLEEDDNGTIDFKSLNLVQEIDEGSVLCDIIPPIQGTDGIDITGKVLTAKKASPPHIPAGKNTHISEDGKQLLATAKGHLTFESGYFCVHESLVINSNIDGSIGNLDFSGDIEIQGDVHDGFTIRATGNIIIRGLVEAATLYAGGDLSLLGGINGNNAGAVTAEGTILSRFLENCTAYSSKSIVTESILNSMIFCNGDVTVTQGKGVIMGGSISAHSLETRVLGSKSNQITNVTLGHPYNQAQLEERITKELAEVTSTLDKMRKNIIYLAGQRELSDQKVEILKNLKLQANIYQTKTRDLKAELEELHSDTPDVSGCRLKAALLNPPVKVTIGRMTRVIDDTISLCNIYLSEEEGDIVIGTL